MGRQEAIARSIILTLVHGTRKRAGNVLAWVFAFCSAFFSLYQLRFEKVRPTDFANLRRHHWSLSDDDYLDSFRPEKGKKPEEGLKPIGDMGFSGSVCGICPSAACSSETMLLTSWLFIRHSMLPPTRSTWSNPCLVTLNTPSSATIS